HLQRDHARPSGAGRGVRGDHSAFRPGRSDAAAEGRGAGGAGRPGLCFSATYNGQPAVPIGIYLQPGANALATTLAVSEKMEEVASRFPEGVAHVIPFDTTLFVEASIKEVAMTFIEAIILVILVVYLFLQSARATIIPIVAVPVSLIGTFAGMYLLG